MTGQAAGPLEPLTIVLVRTRNPLNIGAVARAMQNFGVSDLRVVAPFQAAFREARSAVGAGEILGAAREFADVAEAVADCRLVVGTTAARRRELQQPLVELSTAAAPLRAALAEGRVGRNHEEPELRAQYRVALLFGSEKHGLAREDMDHCHWLLQVPTRASQPSMNLGQAVAVCLWELARAGNGQLPVTAPLPATAPMMASGELERLTVLLLELLAAGGYTHPETQAGTAGEVRRMLRRMHVTDADTHLLMGMARKLLWKLRADG